MNDVLQTHHEMLGVISDVFALLRFAVLLSGGKCCVRDIPSV